MSLFDYIADRIRNLVRLASGSRAITVGSTLETAQIVDMRNFAGGILHIPANSSLTLMTLYDCGSSDGTFQPVKDESNETVIIAVTAGTGRVFPEVIYNCDYIKLVGNVALSCLIHLKS